MSRKAQGTLEDAVEAEAVVEGPSGGGGEGDEKKLPSPLLTRTQAARRMGASPTYVQKLCDEGFLAGEKDEDSGEWFFRADEVERAKKALGLDASPAVSVMRDSAGPSLQIESARLSGALVRDLMNHTNLATRNALAAAEVTSKALEKTYARCEKLEDQLAAAFEAMQSLADHKHQRDLEVLKTGAEQERRDKTISWGMEKFSELWPILKVKLMNVPLARGEHPAWGVLEQLLNGLRPEQVNALVSTLDPPQLALFAELATVFDKGKKEGEVPKGTPPSPA